jgi:hypothetical protein
MRRPPPSRHAMTRAAAAEIRGPEEACSRMLQTPVSLALIIGWLVAPAVGRQLASWHLVVTAAWIGMAIALYIGARRVLGRLRE